MPLCVVSDRFLQSYHDIKENIRVDARHLQSSLPTDITC